MGESICFSPDLSDINGYIRILSVGAGMAIGVLIYSNFNSKIIPKYKHLFQLSAGMGFIICLGLLAFSLWSKSRLYELCIDEKNIKIGIVIYPYSSISNVQIYIDQQGEKMVQISQPDQFKLLIIDIEKQQFVFSEHHYPVMDMYKELDIKLKKK
jgi:hypothetical protein